MSLRAARWALIGWGAAAALVVLAGITGAGEWDSVGPQWTLSFLAAYVAGLWAVRAEPDNGAATRLLLYGCVALTFLAASLGLIIGVQSGLDGPTFALANALVQVVSYGLVAAQVAALARYPDGVPRLAVESRLVQLLVGLAVVLPIVLLLCVPEVVPAWILQFSSESDGLAVPAVASPLYLSALNWLGVAALAVNDSLLALGPLVGVAIVAVRFRLLAEAERHRVAWPLLAGVLLVLGVGVHALAEAGSFPAQLGELIYVGCHILLPLSLGLGIAAPHVFDALGTARRTLPFALLAAVILAMYIAAAGLLGITLGGRNLWVAVLVALLAALVLEPVRRSLMRRASGFAFGPELSRDDLLARVGETLERTMDRQALATSIAEIALEGLGREWVRLEPAGAAAVQVGRPPRPEEEPALSAPLCHGTETIGTISCGPAVGGRIDRRSRLKLDTLARQIALALANARLAEQLNARLAEIEAARLRLLEAEQTARRRFERDLHDGAQQDLAALLTRIALASSQLRRGDVDRLDQTLRVLQTDAVQALENLRELVAGIHETTLADQGLAAAIEGRAARAPIPIEVSVPPELRRRELSATVATTAYFTVCEALANTLKHSAANGASVSLTLDRGTLTIDVIDDGRGFDPTTVRGSSGISGLADRLAAVGGNLDVNSAPGSGTRLTAMIPAGA